MLQASSIIRDARRGAGLTQTSLAARLGVPQSVISRLETPGSNPTWATVCRALEACGRDLAVTVKPTRGSIDPTLTESNLKYTPGERIMRHDHLYASMREIALAGARSRGELV